MKMKDMVNKKYKLKIILKIISLIMFWPNLTWLWWLWLLRSSGQIVSQSQVKAGAWLGLK
jgi:hypothetical protein